MKMLENQWALVTGSSRGIGRQIVFGLAERKCNVIVHGRQAAHLDKVLGELKQFGVRTGAVEGDLATQAGIESVIAGVGQITDRIDILYNNAAIQSQWKPIWDFTQADWQGILQINLFAMVALCNGFGPGMKTRGYGRIVNLSSGIRDVPNLTPYSVSKAAVDKYTADLAAELRGSGVLVNALDPGWLRTDLGGPNGEHEVETVLPGALVPALLDADGPSGRVYAAQDYRDLER
jgi:3-oxoacyl-[acyl-carrier protein] reductase